VTKIKIKFFKGFLSGDIYIDDNGDKETDYTLNDFDPESMEMKVILISNL
jgi:hypothetical protein